MEVTNETLRNTLGKCHNIGNLLVEENNKFFGTESQEMDVCGEEERGLLDVCNNMFSRHNKGVTDENLIQNFNREDKDADEIQQVIVKSSNEHSISKTRRSSRRNFSSWCNIKTMDSLSKALYRSYEEWNVHLNLFTSWHNLDWKIMDNIIYGFNTIKRSKSALFVVDKSQKSFLNPRGHRYTKKSGPDLVKERNSLTTYQCAKCREINVKNKMSNIATIKFRGFNVIGFYDLHAETCYPMTLHPKNIQKNKANSKGLKIEKDLLNNIMTQELLGIDIQKYKRKLDKKKKSKRKVLVGKIYVVRKKGSKGKTAVEQVTDLPLTTVKLSSENDDSEISKFPVKETESVSDPENDSTDNRNSEKETLPEDTSVEVISTYEPTVGDNKDSNVEEQSPKEDESFTTTNIPLVDVTDIVESDDNNKDSNVEEQSPKEDKSLTTTNLPLVVVTDVVESDDQKKDSNVGEQSPKEDESLTTTNLPLVDVTDIVESDDNNKDSNVGKQSPKEDESFTTTDLPLVDVTDIVESDDNNKDSNVEEQSPKEDESLTTTNLPLVDVTDIVQSDDNNKDNNVEEQSSKEDESLTTTNLPLVDVTDIVESDDNNKDSNVEEQSPKEDESLTTTNLPLVVVTDVIESDDNNKEESQSPVDKNEESTESDSVKDTEKPSTNVDDKKKESTKIESVEVTNYPIIEKTDDSESNGEDKTQESDDNDSSSSSKNEETQTNEDDERRVTNDLSSDKDDEKETDNNEDLEKNISKEESKDKEGSEYSSEETTKEEVMTTMYSNDVTKEPPVESSVSDEESSEEDASLVNSNEHNKSSEEYYLFELEHHNSNSKEQDEYSTEESDNSKQKHHLNAKKVLLDNNYHSYSQIYGDN
uniref:ULP_PROTEASE domain-containing protein n=1 Tax=Parastrongyloides trichosuri TaxID=131310 RepID=A0A0N5A6M5_PARTI